MNTTTKENEMTTTTTTQTAEYPIARHLQYMIEQGASARQDIAEKVLTYRVGAMWEFGPLLKKAAQGELAARLVRIVENRNVDSTPRVCMELEKERLTESLLSGYTDANSTSELSNACSVAERDAQRTFLKFVTDAHRALLKEDQNR